MPSEMSFKKKELVKRYPYQVRCGNAVTNMSDAL
jgi:hypothetical protein